ncbi:HD-GYP domain-containing protein [Acetonema longum]|nr:HD domain-containing phosphohydrolase [Acetonema longum]
MKYRMIFAIRPIKLLKALSQSLELTVNKTSQHHWRTAMIAYRIAEYIGMNERTQQALVYAALLHDIGAASDWEERRKLQSFEISNEMHHHAWSGYVLLKNSPQLGFLADYIRHHHDFWDGSSPNGKAGTEIPLISRIIALADRIEVLLQDDVYILDQRRDILTAVRKGSGTVFEPELVGVISEISCQESFWLDLMNANYYTGFFEMFDWGRFRYSIDDMLDIAEVFATIIDRTSQFTAAHSRKVSCLSAFLAQVKGYSEEEIKLMRIAGLMHDLGKLAIPNEILEKNSQLTEQEYAIIKQHTYYTYRLLEQIDGFQMVAEWAAYHHETIDGTGYPFRIGGAGLSLGSRMVAVADVFAALAEDRPYRKPMEFAQLVKVMQSMAECGKIDGSLVKDLFSHKEEIYALLAGIQSKVAV